MNTTRFGRRKPALSTPTANEGQVQPATPRSTAAPLEEVLVTYQLRSRPHREPNWLQENAALHKLARAMAESPAGMIDALLEAALNLCGAGSAGLSMLETQSDGEQLFRWSRLAGRLRDFVGAGSPRNDSACGVTVDLNAPQLFEYPGRRFAYLNEAPVPIVEGLVIPVSVGQDTPATIWIVSHDEKRKFDSEDVRLMTGLAEFTAGALQLMKALESEKRAREDCLKEIDCRKQTEERLVRAQASLEATVQSRTAQLQQLSSRLMALQDEERRRIARELHDSAGQYLAGILMNLRAISHDSGNFNQGQTERLRDSLAMAELCTSEIRTISYLLHPPLLDEVGLASAISWYVEGFSQRSGIRVRLEVQEDIGRLPQDVENAVFRVVQQSLANIHRHSGSEVAQIRINQDAEFLLAEICDEGRGIAPELLRRFHEGTHLVGVGMAGMRERIRDMGGEFDIRSGTSGTTVAVRLPVLVNAQSASA